MERWWDHLRDGNNPPPPGYPYAPPPGYPYAPPPGYPYAPAAYPPFYPAYGYPYQPPYGLPWTPSGVSQQMPPITNSSGFTSNMPGNTVAPHLESPAIDLTVSHDGLSSSKQEDTDTAAPNYDSPKKNPIPLDVVSHDGLLSSSRHEDTAVPDCDSPVKDPIVLDVVSNDDLSSSAAPSSHLPVKDVLLTPKARPEGGEDGNQEDSPISNSQTFITGSPHELDQPKVPSEIPRSDDVEIEDFTVREIVRPDVGKEHIDPLCIEKYLKFGNYPPHLGKNQRSNFRRQVRPYFLTDGKLKYRKKSKEILEVVVKRKEQLRLIQLAHEGGSSSFEASALSGHRGRDAVISVLSKKYFWSGLFLDVREFVRTCEKCQLARRDTLKVVPELRPVPVPKQVMKQIGIDLCQLPQSGESRYIVLAIDYVSKWSEARALPDKSATSVAKFIYSCICKHGCHRVQINDQGREFVNSVTDELFRLTGTKQRITSAYHPQANGLVERQNRTVKSFLLKVLQDRAEEWPSCLEGVLFAHRTMVHASTGYTPFYLVYGREPVLPLDVERGVLDDAEDAEDNELNVDSIGDSRIEGEEEDDPLPFSAPEFQERVESILKLRNVVHNEVQANIKRAQDKQKKYYDKRHDAGKKLWKVGDHVLLNNPRNLFRKGGKMEITLRGPYEIVAVTDNFLCSLRNIKTGAVLKNKHNMKNLCAYSQRKPDLEPDEPDEVEAPSPKKRKEDMEDSDDPEEVPDEQKPVHRFFMPADASWQAEICARLKLKLKAPAVFIDPVPLCRPKSWTSMRSDGNCYFRAMAHLITGDQNDHKLVREHLMTYVEEHKEEYQDINVPEMRRVGTWATEEEIRATAQFLNTNIFVWSVFGKSWQWALFSRLPKKVAVYSGKERALYIKNTNRDHYDVVTSVLTPEEENSRPALR